MIKKILTISFIMLFLHAGLGFSAVTNNGSEVVTVYIEKQNRKTSTFTLNPGQKASMPPDATKVTVKPRGAIREDVDVLVDIVANSGETYSIEEYGKTLNIIEEEENVDLVQGFIINQSNVSVSISIFDRRNKPDYKRLYPGQSIRVPLGTTKVRVDPDGRDWGDETIKVQVDLPDGSPAFIESFGGSVSFLELLEDQSVALPSVIPES